MAQNSKSKQKWFLPRNERSAAEAKCRRLLALAFLAGLTPQRNIRARQESRPTHHDGVWLILSALNIRKGVHGRARLLASPLIPSRHQIQNKRYLDNTANVSKAIRTLIFLLLILFVPLAAQSAVTFSKDIAPILFNRCAACHRPGQAAPFSLLAYPDAKKRAKQIVEVTQSGYMPPWLPEHGYGDFAEERRLTAQEKERIKQWFDEGAAEGDPAQLPPAPQWPDGWTFGKPDLTVTMDKPYVLEADGSDVYRNFVIRVPIDRDRYVRALEFAPGNLKIVHHAFIKLDTTSASRRLDEQDEEPGFSGMNTPATMPNGQFLSWQPGKLPSASPEGLPWHLPKGSDLVLQLHMNSTGKPESIQSSIALYFTDQVPTNSCFKFSLASLALDFPAGASNNVVTDSFTLPADVDVLAVLPHAHYLAKEMQGYAMLPDGTKQWLLWIKQWDFKWQGEYRYSKPVHLPRGTTLQLRYTYDNSTNNLSNPNHPPKRVLYGPQSNDEMCELWFQMVPSSKNDLAALDGASQRHSRRLIKDYALQRTSTDPNNAAAHNELGMIFWSENKRSQAWQEIERALQLNPNLAEAHFNKGVILRLINRLPEAKQELETALRLDSQNGRAYGHLGFVYASMGQAAEAERCFEKALSFTPDDPLIRDALQELRQILKSQTK